MLTKDTTLDLNTEENTFIWRKYWQYRIASRLRTSGSSFVKQVEHLPDFTKIVLRNTIWDIHGNGFKF